MRFLIVTGMCGAGKTQVMHNLEDMGYYCVDNMPSVFLLPFYKLCSNEPSNFTNVAVVMDIRGGIYLKELEEALITMKKSNFEYEILFLEASDDEIIKRYKETRRKHPIFTEKTIADGIKKEKEMLSFLRAEASTIIDTSNLLARDLKKIIQDKYGNENDDYFTIRVESFGFKYGLPQDADLVFDVRFLPNPFYISELKEHNGTEKCVHDYVMESGETREFLNKITDLMNMLIPSYIKEGKTELVIAIGCTGGKHRSVTIAEELFSNLKENYKTTVRHRNLTEGENL